MQSSRKAIVRHRTKAKFRVALKSANQTMALTALVVDDESNILLTLGMVLRSEGFEVQTAPSSTVAKARLAESSFDLVITDLNMETLTAGYEVVKAAKARPKPPIVVVVSGFPDLLSRWETEGADAGLQKPTEVPELLGTIERLLPNCLGKTGADAASN
jgi:CheY-like chemotaxis protein